MVFAQDTGAAQDTEENLPVLYPDQSSSIFLFYTVFYMRFYVKLKCKIHKPSSSSWADKYNPY